MGMEGLAGQQPGAGQFSLPGAAPPCSPDTQGPLWGRAWAMGIRVPWAPVGVMPVRHQTTWVYGHLGPEEYAGTSKAERILLLQGFLKQLANVAGNAPAQLFSHLRAPPGEIMPSYLTAAA